MTEMQTIREMAGVTQIEAAVRAGVSPPTVRAFERHGPDAVIQPAKRARLVALYKELRGAGLGVRRILKGNER